jgi:hypothetical protein
MGFFTPRERAELGKSAEIRGQGKARELVRHDFAPRARPPADPDISGHVGTLVNRVAASSMQEIDDLILELQKRREQLINESERVQREIIEYATLSQSTMQATRIISESLAQFGKIPDALSIGAPKVQDVPAAEQPSKSAAEQPSKSAAEQRNGAGEPIAKHGEDVGAPNDKAEDVADMGDRRSGTI